MSDIEDVVIECLEKNIRGSRVLFCDELIKYQNDAEALGDVISKCIFVFLLFECVILYVYCCSYPT